MFAICLFPAEQPGAVWTVFMMLNLRFFARQPSRRHDTDNNNVDER
jgi:hypothetical protein